MQLKWLKDFISYAAVRNLSKAAESRHVTHPAFGRRIRALEQWIGAPLIDRGSFPAELTEDGRMFLEVANDIVSRLERVREEVQQRKNGGGRSITIGTGRTLARTIFPGCMQQLVTGSSPLQVRLVTGALHDGLIMLRDDAIDLMLCYYADGNIRDEAVDDLEFQTLAVERLIAVSATDARGAVLYSLKESGRVPLLGYSEMMGLGRALARHLNAAKLRTKIEQVFESDFADAIYESVKLGHGIAWLPHQLVQADLANGDLAQLADAGTVELEIRLYRKRNNRRAAVSQAWTQLGSL